MDLVVDELVLPKPSVSNDAEPFWEACQNGELALPFCNYCDSPHFYPRIACPHCGSVDLEWRTVSGRGDVFSFSVVHRARSEAFQAAVPYILALVTLDAGPRMLTNIVGCPIEEVHVGMRVRIAFRRIEDGWLIPVFVKDDEER